MSRRISGVRRRARTMVGPWRLRLLPRLRLTGLRLRLLPRLRLTGLRLRLLPRLRLTGLRLRLLPRLRLTGLRLRLLPRLPRLRLMWSSPAINRSKRYVFFSFFFLLSFSVVYPFFSVLHFFVLVIRFEI
jgi:hypothetical protein